MEQKTVYIKTFGCQMNERDSEIMSQSLLEYGYIEGMSPDDADLIILNTCSIRAKAEQKVMSLLGYLRKNKKARPDMKICVAGCVAQQEGKKIITRMPHVDLVVGTQNIYNIGALLKQQLPPDKRVVTDLDDKYSIPKFLPDPESVVEPEKTQQFHKFVTIMQGCNNYCTYCVVPYTRGREVSRKVSQIIEEVEVLVQSGIKAITLLGQNVNSYGKTNSVIDDNDDFSFADLLRLVAKIEGIDRLRFTTSNPKDLTDDLIDCFRDIDILCPQFHLPVQAGSDAVLQKMNRKYSIFQYLHLVDKLRDACPEIAITTDVIIGFPGETDDDFELTMQLLERVRFHGSFSFKYSDRPGTRASDFEDKIDEALKTERLHRFQKRQDEISFERNEEFIGLVKDVMIEESDGHSAKGRTDTNHIVHFSEPMSVSGGQIVKASITSAGQHSLQGELVKS